MSTVQGQSGADVGLPRREQADLKLEVIDVPALRCSESVHGEHENRVRGADPDWPDWYAEYMAREQSGQELPT